MKPLTILSPISAALLLSLSSSSFADQKIQDDLVVQGSLCVGMDCVNNENFGYDTLRLKENNLRIRFIDTSSSSSFPTRDWQITVNDSANGGANYFGIEDIDAGTTPFTILGAAPHNSLFIGANGNIGLGTSTPVVDLNIKASNTPTLRLEQDNSAGWAAQIWDVGGNETNFFVRDVTNGSKLPFRISPNAPHGSLHIASDGDIGFNTTTPDGPFDVAHSADGNDHAFLIGTNSAVGVNIDNGQVPYGLFDVQTTGGISRFTVDASGDVGIGTATPTGRFDVRGVDAVTPYFNVDANGNVGVGTSAPSAALHIANSDISGLFLDHSNSGNDGWNFTNKDGSLFIVSDGVSTSGAKAKMRIYPSGQTQINVGATQLFDLDSLGNLTVNSLSQTSSRTAKDNIRDVNGELLLALLEQLDIKRWNYKSNSSTEHIGPIAEDFYQLFQLGTDEKHISSMDTAGIALAAIKYLSSAIKVLNTEIKQRDNKVVSLEKQLNSIENKINSMPMHKKP